MQLAILFWFYKDLAICKNRLRILRRYNQGAAIYGLYGGPIAGSPAFEQELSPFLDDYFCYPHEKEPLWKWRNGDFLINEWYCARGHCLSWDTIIVVQWDLLLFGDINEVFFDLGKDEILLSSLRSLEDVSERWFWTSPEQGLQHARYKAFSRFLLGRYNFRQNLMACHFVIACLPRRFLELYSSIGVPELGFIEYRLPTYAKLFEIPFCGSKRFDGWWSHESAGQKNKWTILPTGMSIPIFCVLRHLLRRNGSRLFHPFAYTFPIDLFSVLSFLFSPRRIVRMNQWIKEQMISLNLWRAKSAQGVKSI